MYVISMTATSISSPSPAESITCKRLKVGKMAGEDEEYSTTEGEELPPPPCKMASHSSSNVLRRGVVSNELLAVSLRSSASSSVDKVGCDHKPRPSPVVVVAVVGGGWRSLRRCRCCRVAAWRSSSPSPSKPYLATCRKCSARAARASMDKSSESEVPGGDTDDSLSAS
jgi:hypothetical protein